MLAAIRAGVTGDAAVIPEPSGLDIVTAHAGAITFRLTITGKAAHASKRREGVSALDKLAVLTDALAADEAARNAAERRPRMVALGLPYPTIIGKVSGGEWASTVIDRIVAEGRYGVRLGDAWRQAEVELRAAIAAACAADPWLRDHPVDGRDHRRAVLVGRDRRRPPAAGRPRPGRRGHARPAAGLPRRAVWGRHAPADPGGRHADGDLRAGPAGGRPRPERAWSGSTTSFAAPRPWRCGSCARSGRPGLVRPRPRRV